MVLEQKVTSFYDKLPEFIEDCLGNRFYMTLSMEGGKYGARYRSKIFGEANPIYELNLTQSGALKRLYSWCLDNGHIK